MAEAGGLQGFVYGADVDSAVFTLRPDYRVLLLAVDGLAPGASGEALLRRAQEAAVAWLTDVAAEELPHIAAWSEAYRDFGTKPQRTRNSRLLRAAGTDADLDAALTTVYGTHR